MRRASVGGTPTGSGETGDPAGRPPCSVVRRDSPAVPIEIVHACRAHVFGGRMRSVSRSRGNPAGSAVRETDPQGPVRTGGRTRGCAARMSPLNGLIRVVCGTMGPQFRMIANF